MKINLLRILDGRERFLVEEDGVLYSSLGIMAVLSRSLRLIADAILADPMHTFIHQTAIDYQKQFITVLLTSLVNIEEQLNAAGLSMTLENFDVEISDAVLDSFSSIHNFCYSTCLKKINYQALTFHDGKIILINLLDGRVLQESEELPLDDAMGMAALESASKIFAIILYKAISMAKMQYLERLECEAYAATVKYWWFFFIVLLLALILSTPLILWLQPAAMAMADLVVFMFHLILGLILWVLCDYPAIMARINTADGQSNGVQVVVAWSKELLWRLIWLSVAGLAAAVLSLGCAFPPLIPFTATAFWAHMFVYITLSGAVSLMIAFLLSEESKDFLSTKLLDSSCAVPKEQLPYPPPDIAALFTGKHKQSAAAQAIIEPRFVV